MAYRDGTQGGDPPSWHHQRCHRDGPVGRGGYWEQTVEQSLARLGSSVLTHLMRGMRVLGLRWESQGCHGASVSMVNTRPNSGSQEG